MDSYPFVNYTANTFTSGDKAKGSQSTEQQALRGEWWLYSFKRRVRVG